MALLVRPWRRRGVDEAQSTLLSIAITVDDIYVVVSRSRCAFVLLTICFAAI